MFSAVCYQNELVCHFCHDWCMHPMRLMSTCVFIYAMSSLQRCYPCIFVICVLSASSFLSRVLAVTVLLGWICYFVMLCKPAATSHFMHMINQNDHQDVLFILFHWAMFIWGHLDAWIIVARVLYDVVCCLLTEHAHLSFLPCLMCASYEADVYMCFEQCHAIFTVVYAMYFCDQCGD